MTIELPDTPNFSPDEARLELACALYARGRIGKVAGAEMAGVDFFSFQRALGERGIPVVTDPSQEQELEALRSLFPK